MFYLQHNSFLFKFVGGEVMLLCLLYSLALVLSVSLVLLVLLLFHMFCAFLFVVFLLYQPYLLFTTVSTISAPLSYLGLIFPSDKIELSVHCTVSLSKELILVCSACLKYVYLT